jgi:polar amino acid transport system ATP-binding protein
MVGLVEIAENYPHQLSGGQQQRIAIARCLAMEQEVLLLDEPTSALDPTMNYEVLSIIKKLTKTGITMIIVTHEMAFAKEVSDRVFYMDEGIIYEEGSHVDIFEHPRKVKTQVFIRGLKIFHYTITSRDFDLIAMNAQIELFNQKHQIPSLCGIFSFFSKS